MVFRIRLKHGPRIRGPRNTNRALALAMSALLAPAALMALVLAFWRVAADLGWSGEFAIADGIFSHWQVWIAMAAVIEGVSIALARYGRGGGERTPD